MRKEINTILEGLNEYRASSSINESGSINTTYIKKNIVSRFIKVDKRLEPKIMILDNLVELNFSDNYTLALNDVKRIANALERDSEVISTFKSIQCYQADRGEDKGLIKVRLIRY